MQKPIFIAFTRSFWLTLSGLALLLGAGEPVVRGVCLIVCPLLGLEVDATVAWVTGVSPAILWIAAQHQRSGSARPYSINPKDT